MRFDVTLEPGIPAAAGTVPGERSTGSLPDLTLVPRHPYRPSLEDFRRSDPARSGGLWMLPVTTGRLGPLVRRLRRLYCPLAGRDLRTDVIPLGLALRPVLFRGILEAAVASPDARPLVFVLRTDAGSNPRDMRRLQANVDYLLQRCAERLVFVTPGEAMRILGLA